MRHDKIGTMLLVGATVVVGISIALDGGAARALNALGGMTWFGAATVLAVAAVRSSRSPRLWTAVVLMTTLVAFVIRPSDMVLAVIGFGLAGAAIVWIAPSHELHWATLIVALYLPFHIGAAIVRMVGRSLSGMEATIRTEPPPTAALVPLVMVLAAMGGGLVGQRIARVRAVHARNLSARDA